MRYRRVQLAGGSFFFTLVTHQRIPLFADREGVQLWHHAVAKVQGWMPFEVEAQVVMLDHVHMLWSLPEGDSDYPTRIRLLKSAFTRTWVRTRAVPTRSASRIDKREQMVWQRRYWEHTIRDDADFQAHLDYIHINPVRHGLAAVARDWPHSMFHEWQELGVYEPWWGSAEMPPLSAWVGRE